MTPVLSAAREKLKDVTPLKSDCGRVCGARCCRSAEGEETGMLLFPGEEACYAGKPGWTVRPAAAGWLAICPGSCRREERPLACRLFPLLPREGRDGGIIAVTDLRAKAVCPLARQGKRALDPAFINAVREAGILLYADAAQAAFLRMLSQEQDELKQLRRMLGGGRHV